MIRGGNGLADGPVKPEVLDQVMKKVAQQGFAHKPEVSAVSYYQFYNSGWSPIKKGRGTANFENL